MQIVPKLSVKTMGCDPAQGKKEKVRIARMWGVASKLVGKQDRDGNPLTGLSGEFRGINIDTGEEYHSGVCYLPSGIQELVENAVDTGELDDKDRPVYTSVQFGFDIFALPASNPAGYTYEAQTLTAAKESDPLADMAADFPALPKPGGDGAKTGTKSGAKKGGEEAAE